jgi:sugar lactone lactonase YvrE
VEDLVTSGLSTPEFIALDVAGGWMYWTDDGTGKIQRAALDGSGVEDLVTSGVSSPLGIALDVAGGWMYWTDGDTGKIQRAALDGSGLVEDLVTPRGLFSSSIGIALDVAGGWMYWTDFGKAKIQRATHAFTIPGRENAVPPSSRSHLREGVEGGGGGRGRTRTPRYALVPLDPFTPHLSSSFRFCFVH